MKKTSLPDFFSLGSIVLVFFFLLLFFPGLVNGLPREGRYVKLFDEVCRLIEERFYNPSLVETLFKPEKATFRKKVETAHSLEEFSALVNELIGKLQTSHTGFFAKHSQEYFHYLSVFENIPEIKRIFHNRTILYPSVGMYTRNQDGKTFVYWVLDGSPADFAGVRKGDEILDADGAPFHSYRSLRHKVGKPVSFTIRRKPGQEPLKLRVVPRLMNPHKEFMEALQKSVRIFSVGKKKIGYIHIWSYAGEDFHEAFVEEIIHGKLKNADSLIWDLRDGLGGANPDYLNIFNRAVPIVFLKVRSGDQVIRDPQWRKPVVMMTNSRSKSGKEILAFGFKKFHFGTIVGETTGGAVSGGQIMALSDGSLLYVAVSGGNIDGEILEGKGVTPDIEVPMPIPYLAGEDIQLAKAIQILAKK